MKDKILDTLCGMWLALTNIVRVIDKSLPWLSLIILLYICYITHTLLLVIGSIVGGLGFLITLCLVIYAIDDAVKSRMNR
jgi:hypothetical protein